MARKQDKKALRVREVYNNANSRTRQQWEYVNQKGFDFANDNQLTEREEADLTEQGMPTFTINRILPVVEMLNFYATANPPRWQAIASEGSDSDVAAVFSDMADYIWNLSDGVSLYSNAVNDAITKSVGYLLVTVDPDSDHGMGDVKIQQPDPFDVYVDPKSRDILFKDAAFIIIRKVLPKAHVTKLFPQFAAKIKKASSDDNTDWSYTEKVQGGSQKDFTYKDIGENESIDPLTGETDKLIELFEMYEKIKIAYMNVFYRVPPDEAQIKQIQQQVQVQMAEMQKEMQVQLLEQDKQMQEAVQSGEMLPERYQLEMQKAQQMMEQQLAAAEQQFMSELQAQASKIETMIISEKEFKVFKSDPENEKLIVDAVKFFGNRIKLTCVSGDTTLYEHILPDNITEYPIIPIHFKWTGTPFPISAVSPLIGKQREINKAHQIMVHNASLGSSLRFLHEEGSIDTDYWEKYSSAPGALLPIRPGAQAPTPIMPAPLSNAFYTIVQEGKGDMEYLAGIYSSMQGDTGQQHDTYRGMLAIDEYGTRRVKQWLKNAIEPALRQTGQIVKQFSQAVYTAHKVIRIVQPNNIDEEKTAEINMPIYNDLGKAIGKFNDYATAKFDIRIIAGSTLPVNRWAYLEELKSLMQLGIVDDVAVLAETDIRNKASIIKRKSLYAQLQGQVSQLSESVKDKDGTIETLERQLVQAGIKQKVMQAEVEISKEKGDVKNATQKQYLETEAQQKLLRNVMKNEAETKKKELGLEINSIKNALTGNDKNT